MEAEEFFGKTVDEGTPFVWNRERSISLYKRFIIKLWRSKDLNSFRSSQKKKKKVFYSLFSDSEPSTCPSWWSLCLES
jgi:hypothetical protein